MASGEITPVEFTQFLASAFRNFASHCTDGAIIFICMDWRHMSEMLEAGKAAFTKLKNLIVWDKLTSGMG